MLALLPPLRLLVKLADPDSERPGDRSALSKLPWVVILVATWDLRALLLALLLQPVLYFLAQ